VKLRPFFAGKRLRGNSVLLNLRPKNKLKRCLESSKKLRSLGKSRKDGNRRKLKREKNLKRKLPRKLSPLNRIGKGELLKRKSAGKNKSVLS
jgi:hypothetical protein